MSSIWEAEPVVIAPPKPVVLVKKSNPLGWLLLVGLVIIASTILGIYIYERKKKKDQEAAAAGGNGSLTGGSNGGSGSLLGGSAATSGFEASGLTPSPYYPPAASPVSSLTVPGVPQEDPGRPGSDAAWWHNVERYDMVSQTAVNPYGGWLAASPTIQGRDRGQFYRGYGSWNQGPYQSGFLTFPSNFIPLSTTQISVTDLHPFCSKQR
jgi:hypothetical protein